ncbi:catalase A [Entomophthora muscae]|uniref:Catalase A n=1 Tax=Entomophthora muscae TaxID=34485 RepID=A0ACC2SZX5_9FUNG|nr:catalase A [Entomophthora muscae]
MKCLILSLATTVLCQGQKSQPLTTNDGQPIDNDMSLLTVGQDGPALLQDFQFIEKMAHFDRERIPERVVHAKGSGAYGYFEVTKDITKLTIAKVFSSVGKRTRVFTRFSTVGQEHGSSDSVRDPRGFAVKFYTEDGNWDLVGNNLPVFFIRDATKFPDFVHTQKRNPQSGLPDPDAFWDFLSKSPESVHMVTFLFSDLGIPEALPFMNGFGVHAFKLVKADGDYNYVKFHWITEQGIRNLTSAQAAIYAGSDKDRDRKQLFNTIKNKKYPSWKMHIQVMTKEQANKVGPAAIDATKIWPEDKFPLHEVGRLVLNQNPDNFFAETEQSAFTPGHIVRGIDFSEDKMLMGRVFAYGDTHRHRLGTNYLQIPVNRPNVTVYNNQRDGAMSVLGNFGSHPNYFAGDGQFAHTLQSNVAKSRYSGQIGRYIKEVTPDDFTQAGELYRKYDSAQRDRLIKAIAGHLKDANPTIRERQFKVFSKADPDYGSRVKAAVNSLLKKF